MTRHVDYRKLEIFTKGLDICVIEAPVPQHHIYVRFITLLKYVMFHMYI